MLAAIALQGGILGLPLLLLLFSWSAKYGFVLMDHAADGGEDPPPLSMQMVNPADEQRPLALALLVAAGWGATAALAPLLGDTAVGALRFIGLALLPAVAAAMGATRSSIRGLDPRLALGLVRRVPLAYLALVLAIAVLWAGVPALLGALGLAGAAPLAVTIALALYLWLAVFGCIGGLLFAERDELGLDARSEAERRQAQRDAERERGRDVVMDRLFAEWRGGEHAEALGSVRRLLAEAADPLETYRWLYARACRWEDPRLAGHLARWAVPRLLAARATGEVLELVRGRLRADPAFRPHEAAELVSLVGLARAAGDRALVAQLLRDFERHYPGSPATPVVEQLRREAGAMPPVN